MTDAQLGVRVLLGRNDTMSKYTTQDLSVSPDARRMGVSGNVIPISSVRAIMLGGSYSATEKGLAEEVAASFQLAKTVAVLLGMPEETSIVDLAAALKAKMLRDE